LFLAVNVNLIETAFVLKEHRALTKMLENGDCDITVVAEKESADAGAKKTLLASYPGSGKRFTWNVISALTNHITADDHNLSGHLDQNPLIIKTSWPHKEGVWSWGDSMDQVLLLVRNPRWAIPSYHTMRYELNFATDLESTRLRIANVYTGRPGRNAWVKWRNENLGLEMENYVNYIDFWLSGGEKNGAIDTHCETNHIDCHPKAVLDFDTFYQTHPTTEFFKLGQILEQTANVEVIAAQARVCVLDKIFDAKELHNGNRIGNGPTAPSLRFTARQLDYMVLKLTELRDKYQLNTDPIVQEAVVILSNYITQVAAEVLWEEGMGNFGLNWNPPNN
jgi:hypothetical protein